ncbi:DNA-processing protein DprA [Gloeothece verrucosa]|uniref:DNA-processing protein DprA n=1 Tax=Gloeothece verrucosa TaxID=2546359 RepID=UPI0003113377|nr:DNA-processing protein DprA [Gloeothece verrucosa]
MSIERAYWVAWSQISGIGPVLLKRIYQHFQSLEIAWSASTAELGAVEGLGKRILAAISETRSKLNPEQFLQQHMQKNPYFWTPADSEYPQLLWEIPSPPPVLYYRGQVKAEENQGITPMIAIVGTRYPTEHGRRWTHKISSTLAQQGFTVVSGMAAGIDGQAHRSCLENGGRTLAVLGTGVDIAYPSSHRQLHQEIQQQGLLLSEYSQGTKVDRSNFPARNRIIAGLCRAILVMEAPLKSGALITARYGNEFGRDVYTLPNSPEVEEAKGCLKLLHQGAEVIVEVEELLESLGAMPNLDTEKQKQLSIFEQTPIKAMPDLSIQLTEVLQAVGVEPTAFDLIVQKTGLCTGEVSAALLQLELFGVIAQLPGMRYQRT